MNNQTIIIQAIQEKKLIEFKYNNETFRKVEPYLLGISKKNNILLSAYQIYGDSTSNKEDGWKLFHLEKISDLNVLIETFDVRSDYKPNDSRMINIIERI